MLKFQELPLFEAEEKYKFLLDVLNQSLSISDEMLKFFLQFKTLEEMKVSDRIRLKQFLEKNELQLQHNNLNSLQLFGFHHLNEKQIKLIKIAEWRKPNYICQKSTTGEMIFIPTLNTWSSFDGVNG